MRRVVPLLTALVLAAGSARAFVWPSTVERVAAGLAAEDPVTRKHAAKKLALLPARSARRLGAPLLDDPDVDIRIAALDALLLFGTSGLGGRVMGWLGDADPRARRAAAEALSRDPVPSAVGALGRSLSDPDAAVRAASARALGASRLPAAVVPLLGRLDDQDPDVREAVAMALSRIHDQSAVVPLIGRIQDSRPNVRRSVARALGALGDARAASALVLLLRDADGLVRTAALEALGDLRATEAELPIASLLVDERRPEVRQAALNALSSIPSEGGLVALIAALEGDDPREDSPVRAALVRAGDRAVPKLSECLRGQPAPNLAEGCVLTLGEMRAPRAADIVVEALRRGVVRPRTALRALGAARNPAALGTVLEYLSAEDPWVRLAAIDAASALLDPREPDGRAVDPVLRALDAAHGRRTERTALVSLLGKTGSPRAVPWLTALASSASDPVLRLSAVKALGELGRAGQDAALMEALAAPESTIRLAASMALRATASPRSLPPLIHRLEVAAEQDRDAIALALAGSVAGSQDEAMLGRLEGLVRATDGGRRDALIEALGEARGSAGSAPLVRLLAGGTEPATRAKVAEALSTHPEARSALATLAADPDPAVRANAVWSLGVVGNRADAALLEARVADRDVTVAGNAAAALGLLSHGGASVREPLCHALSDERPYVRANALAALGVVHARCGVENALLATDPSEIVRARAARLVSTVRGPDADADRDSLSRCAAEDPSGEVAAACRSQARTGSRPASSILVFVVPSGATVPVPRAPFTLVRADGLSRLGLADRRGAVHEALTPAGEVHLDIPAPLVW